MAIRKLSDGSYRRVSRILDCLEWDESKYEANVCFGWKADITSMADIGWLADMGTTAKRLGANSQRRVDGAHSPGLTNGLVCAVR